MLLRFVWSQLFLYTHFSRFPFVLMNVFLCSCGKARKDSSASSHVGDAVAMIKGEGKNLRRKEKRIRIEQIRANLGLSDSQRTPVVGSYL